MEEVLAGGGGGGGAMRLHELFNISYDDLDYYLNYTVLLHSPTIGQTDGAEDDAGGPMGADVELVADDYAGCGLGLHKIRRSVHLVHGFLSLIICLAGCLANVVNIMVLSRRELRRTAINRILCSLAVADFLLMLEYIPFACHMYLFPGRSLEAFYSYSWAVFVLFHAHFTLVRPPVLLFIFFLPTCSSVNRPLASFFLVIPPAVIIDPRRHHIRPLYKCERGRPSVPISHSARFFPVPLRLRPPAPFVFQSFSEAFRNWPKGFRLNENCRRFFFG